MILYLYFLSELLPQLCDGLILHVCLPPQTVMLPVQVREGLTQFPHSLLLHGDLLLQVSDPGIAVGQRGLDLLTSQQLSFQLLSQLLLLPMACTFRTQTYISHEDTYHMRIRHR